MLKKENWIVFSLGGSLIFQEKLDFLFLKRFKNFILKWTGKGKKFIIFVGGGKIARDYQKVAKKLGVFKNEDLDEIGIEATYLNATLLKSIFKNFCFQKILKNPKEKVKTKKKIIIQGGYKPGWSTDFDAALAAKTYGSKILINLTNVDYLYTKDPRSFKGAKPIKKIKFEEVLKMIDQKWKPGLNFPFDFKALKLAKKEKMKVIILNGKKLKNLENILKGKRFEGTIID